MLRDGLGWRPVVDALGYFDQAHLAHALRRYAGAPRGGCRRTTTQRCRSCTRSARGRVAKLRWPAAAEAIPILNTEENSAAQRQRLRQPRRNHARTGCPDEDRSGGFDRGGWLVPHASAHTNEVVEGWFGEADAFLFGRTSYGLLGGYWPKVTAPGDLIASKLNTRPKYVVSQTLTDQEADWSPTTVLRDDIVDTCAPAQGASRQGTPGSRQLEARAGAAPGRTGRPLPAAPVPGCPRYRKTPVSRRIDAVDLRNLRRERARAARRCRLAGSDPDHPWRDLRGVRTPWNRDVRRPFSADTEVSRGAGRAGRPGRRRLCFRRRAA